MLKCSKCREEKDESCFFKRKDRKRGYTSMCKECTSIKKKENETPESLERRRARDREYHKNNKEQRNKKTKEWREKDRKKYLESQNKSRLKHLDKRLKESRENYYRRVKENPVDEILKRKYRSSILRVYRNSNIIDSCFDYDKFKDLWYNHNNECHYCKSNIDIYSAHIEHKVAICNGGGHALDNIVFSCPKCNFEKSYKRK